MMGTQWWVASQLFHFQERIIDYPNHPIYQFSDNLEIRNVCRAEVQRLPFNAYPTASQGIKHRHYSGQPRQHSQPFEMVGPKTRLAVRDSGAIP